MSLYTFIHCANEGCENANDYILIGTNENFELLKIDYSECRIRDEKWVLNEAYFIINSVQNFMVGDFLKIKNVDGYNFNIFFMHRYGYSL